MKFKSIRYSISEVKSIREIATAYNYLYQAPNNKRSNLTKFLWLTVRTKSFKSFFGNWINIKDNSLTGEGGKIIDSNGEPLVVEFSNADVLGFTFDELTKHINISDRRYGEKSFYHDKFFLNAENIIEVKGSSDDTYHLFNQLVIQLLNLTMHDVLNIINAQSDTTHNPNKIGMQNDLKWIYDDYHIDGDGSSLFSILKNHALGVRSFDKRGMKTFLRDFAVYISRGSLDYINNGFKNILGIDCIKHRELYGDDYHYSYSIFDRGDIISIYNSSTEFVYEGKYFLNYESWLNA